MRFLSIAAFLFLLFSCADNVSESSRIFDFVPEKTFVIIKTNDFDNLKSSLNNNNLCKTISNTSSLQAIKQNLEYLKYVNPIERVLLCFSKDALDSIQYSLITKLTKDVLKTDSLPNYVEEALTYKNKTILKHTVKNTFYSTIKDSILFISSSLKLTEAVYEDHIYDEQLEKLYETSNDEKTASAILNTKVHAPIRSFFLNDSISNKNFSNYYSVDADFSQNEIHINGITKAMDSSRSLINVFRGTFPQKNLMSSITPATCEGFLSITFDEFDVFRKNLIKFREQDSIVETALFDNIIEVGVIYEQKEKAIVLNSIDDTSTNEVLLDEQNIETSFRQIDIYSFSKPELFSQIFYPFIRFNDAKNYCVIDNFFVFADSVETLQNIITNYQNQTTLNNRDYFTDIQKELSDQSSLLTVINHSAFSHVISQNLNDSITPTLEAYKATALQFVYDDNFAHLNAIIKKNKTRGLEHTVSEDLNISLDAEPQIAPQLITNHYTKEKEIVVQDINNTLYLISNKGKLLWKKRLDGKVLGNIQQIDIYKNGRLQLLFSTPHQVYLLDRNGENVPPFPVKFNDPITQPLSLFDYDNKKDYRILVTQGKHIAMYTKNAEIVKGFTFRLAQSNVIQQPQHFRIGNKDYIVIKTDDQLNILDRTGKTRIKVKPAITYSDALVYNYNDKFTTTTKNGDLVSIDTNGNVTTQNLNLTDQHSIEATNRTLVTFYENKLKIKDKTVDLDYGNYTQPKIFYINDKIYVAISDLQAQKVYLFDSQAELLPNFPLYGNSEISLENIDGDNNLEFVVKGDLNNILIYKIN